MTEETEKQIQEIETLGAELRAELEQCSKHLQGSQNDLQSDLRTSTQNLRDLVGAENSDVNQQLEHLSGTSSSIEALLTEVSQRVEAALSASRRLDHFIGEVPPQSHDESSPANQGQASSDDEVDAAGMSHDVEMSAKQAASVRHDEKITPKTILRSLLMANEPQQRERRHTENR